MAEIFKAPPDVRLENEENIRHFSPHRQSYPHHKRKRNSKEYGEKKRRRTADDFLMFCRIILEHENYEQIRSQDLRLRHSSSPLGSTGSSNESWQLSKDDYDANMYSPQHNNDIDEDINRNSTEEDRDTVSEDDSWDQVTCYCGKPFAGRPMIECSKCLTWVHLKCAGLRRTNIPDTWHCAKCKSKQLDKSELAVAAASDTGSPILSSKGEENQPKPAVVSGSRKRKSTKHVQHHPASRKLVNVESSLPQDS